MGAGSYGVGSRTSDGKLKILVKVLDINNNLLRVKMGLKA